MAQAEVSVSPYPWMDGAAEAGPDEVVRLGAERRPAARDPPHSPAKDLAHFPEHQPANQSNQNEINEFHQLKTSTSEKFRHLISR